MYTIIWLMLLICHQGEQIYVSQRLVRLHFSTASTCPGSALAQAHRRSRCCALFICPSVCPLLFVEKRNPKHCEPDVDQMTLGNSIRSVHIVSTLISVRHKEVFSKSKCPGRHVANSIHLDLTVRQIQATANNY